MDDANEFAERGKLDFRDHDEIGRKELGNIRNYENYDLSIVSHVFSYVSPGFLCWYLVYHIYDI